jgi:hypothetical protein
MLACPFQKLSRAVILLHEISSGASAVVMYELPWLSASDTTDKQLEIYLTSVIMTGFLQYSSKIQVGFVNS